MPTEPVNQCAPSPNVGELAHWLIATPMPPIIAVELATWIEEGRGRMKPTVGWQENHALKEQVAAQDKRIRELVDEEQRAWRECGAVERKLEAVSAALNAVTTQLQEANKKLGDIPTLVFTDMANKGEDYFRRLRTSIAELIKNHR